MKRSKPDDISSFGKDVTIRATRQVADVLQRHMRQDRNNEQMAFALGSVTRTAGGTLFLVRELILPDRCDLSEQSAAGVCPTPECQAYVYWKAQQGGFVIIEFHTHPGGGEPHFSGTDDKYAHANGEYIRKKMQEPVTLVMIVGNNRFDAFDGVVFDRCTQQFRALNRIEFLGRPNELRLLGEAHESAAVGEELYDRQMRVPGWNQTVLERQRIGIIGAGGNGAALFQTLISMGAGRRGFVAIADHDTIEVSNLPRIPYASVGDIGSPKVNAAARYAKERLHGTPVYAFPCRFEEQAVLQRMKEATVLFYCGDNDGGRKNANEFAIRYGIPLIEMGCDVQVSAKEVHAGGQVRLVLPGENACLVCCRGYDPAEAAIDNMDDVARAERAQQGYVRGAADAATPSIVNLNGLTVQFAVSQFLALTNGPSFAQWEYLHLDQFTGRTIPARSKRREDCPMCGATGNLMSGDPELHETKYLELRRVQVQA